MPSRALPTFVTALVGPTPALKLPADGGDVCRSPAITQDQRVRLNSIVVRQWEIDGADDEESYYVIWLNAYVPEVVMGRCPSVNPAMPLFSGDIIVEMMWVGGDASGVIDLTPYTLWAMETVSAWVQWRVADARASELAFRGRGRSFTLSCDEMRAMAETPDAVRALECGERLRAIALPRALGAADVI